MAMDDVALDKSLVVVFQREVVHHLFFFNDTATPEIYTLSLHDALPISFMALPAARRPRRSGAPRWSAPRDRKSTRLNSSHSQISYAVFCLKKKNTVRSQSREAHTPAFGMPSPCHTTTHSDQMRVSALVP